MRKIAFAIFALIAIGLAAVLAQRLATLYQEYQKYRDIELKTNHQVRTLPDPSVKVTPVDIEALTIKPPKSSITSGVDQCEYSKQFKDCLEISKTKTDGNDYATTNFNFVIESCRAAAKDLAIRSIDIIPENCRGQ